MLFTNIKRMEEYQMSRLYAWVDSDSRKTTVTTRGHERIDIRVNYGSVGNSMKAIRIHVHYPKDATKPTVYIDKGNVFDGYTKG